MTIEGCVEIFYSNVQTLVDVGSLLSSIIIYKTQLTNKVNVVMTITFFYLQNFIIV